MRLLLAATMITAGFAVTLGTASVLRDVHVAWSKSGQGGRVEVIQIGTRVPPISGPQDSHI
jgi:hypothetical protein